MEEMIAHYEDTRSNTFFSQLINLKKKGSVTEHIENFQRLNIKVTDIPDEHLIDVFIGNLKDNIQHEVHLWEPKSLVNAFKVSRNVESKNTSMATRRTYPNIYRENNAPSPKTPQPGNRSISQLRNRSISESLIKWRKLPAEDSTWEDESFIQKHPKLLKRCGQHLSQGEGHVKP